MAFQLLDDSHVSGTITGADDKGNPAPTPSGTTAAWASSDPTIATAVADPGDSTGLTVLVTATGKLGSCQIQGNVTAPDGTQFVATGGELEVIASAMTGFAIQFGTPAKN